MDSPYLFLNLRIGLNRVFGESTERFFEDQIAIESLSWEMESSHQPVDVPKQPATKQPAKVVTLNKPKRVVLTKSFDKSTISLCDCMNKRKLYEVAKITMVKSLAWEEKPRPLIEMTLTRGYVESVSLRASESDKSIGVKEEVTLSFSRIKMLYFPDAAVGPGKDAAATTFELAMPSEIQ